MTAVNTATAQRLVEQYPVLQQIPADLREQVLAHNATVVTVPAATPLFSTGSPCAGFPMVLTGTVRVARSSPDGRSLELYRVTPGELCVVSASCLFGNAALVAQGDTTEATELVLLSPAGFERWTQEAAFRHYVFGSFADRLADLMALTEAVAFQRLDQRLAAALLGHGATVHVTHQALADELGTVREIVSRLLKRFERAGWIAVARERIDLLDAAALRAVASAVPPAGPGASAV